MNSLALLENTDRQARVQALLLYERNSADVMFVNKPFQFETPLRL